MPASNHAHYQYAFAQLDSQVKEICETDLFQKLHDPLIVQSSNSAWHLFNALKRLRDTVYVIRKEHGREGPIRDWNPFIPKPPPRTPSPERRISALEVEVIELKDTTKKRNMELEQASVRLDEYREELSKANKIIEKLGCQLASEYETNKRFDRAAEQYDFLSRLKDEELNQKKSNNDSVGADATEKVWLSYSHQKGKMLLHASRFAEAEQTIRQVLKKGKKIHNDAELKRPENREAQLQLCTALRSQGVASKRKDAEVLYHRESLLTHLETQDEADRSWAIRNEFEVAYVNAEQASYDRMISHLNNVWPLRGRASSESRQYLETASVQLWRLLEQRKEASYAGKVLAIYCEGGNGLPPEFLDLITEQGKALQKLGDHETAIYFLRKAWETPSAFFSGRWSLGLSFAWSLCHLKQFSESSKILENLLSSSKPNTSPSEHEPRALLAYAHLHLGNLVEAEKNARIVLNQCGTSALSGFHTLNHADVLIRALVRHDTKEKYLEAYVVWQRIYADRNRIALAPKGKEQLRSHAEVGKELAENWKRSANGRGIRDPAKPREVRTQAKKFGEMAG